MPSDLSVYSDKLPESVCVLLEKTYHVQTYTNGRDLLRVCLQPKDRDFWGRVEMKIDGAGCPSHVSYQLSPFSDLHDEETLYSPKRRQQQNENYRQLSKYFCGLDKYYTDEQGILRADRSEENILACVQKVIIFHAARCGVPVETFKR